MKYKHCVWLKTYLAPIAAALLLLALLQFLPSNLLAQDSDPAQTTPTPNAGVSPDDSDSTPTMVPHFESDRFWLSGQVNFITQWHPTFNARYSGANSLSARSQDATSRVLTLFTGLRISNSTELILDVQETGGHGVGQALGLAGFTNLDVVRNPTLSKAPYIARLTFHAVIPLGGGSAPSGRTPFSLFSTLPNRRLEIRFGKISMVDFFDVNSYASDSNFQFMNWTIDNNGAYDYAADTRGYTFGAMVEYDQPHLALRFAEALMPKVANGIDLDADLARARAENVELELHRTVVLHQEGTLRLLAFANHANMGIYSRAIDDFEAGLTPTPDITAHPLQTTTKYGFGINFEQPLNRWLGAFGRIGWNEGQHESYAYTEVDQTFLFGVAGRGGPWRRKSDRIGFAFVSNGISRIHQEYLNFGGLGFLLGDGRLGYGRENTEEGYYTLHLWRGIYPSLDLQHVNDPGYNRDRGPVFVASLRLHLEF